MSETAKRMVSLPELSEYLGLGRNRADLFAVEAGAKRKIGRRALYDLRVVDAALDRLAPAGQSPDARGGVVA